MGYSKEAATLLVAFHEGAAAAFFKEPLHELFGLHIGLDYFIHRSTVAEIEERLAEAKSNLHRIAIVEQFLCSILKKPQLDPLILKAVQAIKLSHGDIRIKDLVAELPISLDTFEKRFKRVIGTSPKQFSTIVRLRGLIENYPQAKSLTDAAVTAGYFDQAHFIKAFKTFTGQTPTAFFNASPYW
jgi:AraC-like DNA-binding protein